MSFGMILQQIITTISLPSIQRRIQTIQNSSSIFHVDQFFL
jgi:hypothetical protein